MSVEPWMDRAHLRGVQYRTDAKLAARQSLYAYQRPRLDLPRLVIDLAEARGGDTVTDVGCGNGRYLAELSRRGHPGPLLGVDFSVGMLQATRDRAPPAHVLAGDAAALPLRDGVSDLTLAMHMLYHLPDPGAAVTELRRITRPGGRVIVGLNGPDHLRELRDLVTVALPEGPAAPLRTERLRLDHGQALLGPAFASVARHDFTAELLIPGPEPVADYIRSMVVTDAVADPGRFVAAAVGRIPFGADGTFRVRTHTGCLICA